MNHQYFFLVNSNKNSIHPYLNKKFSWVNQILVDSTKHFSGCFRLLVLTVDIFLGVRNPKIANSKKCPSVRYNVCRLVTLMVCVNNNFRPHHHTPRKENGLKQQNVFY